MHKLIIIAGPSGAGKTTISDYLQRTYGIARVITHTTRPPRPGEKEGISYYFETPASFRRLHFIEHVRYGSYQYGSSREALQKAWTKSPIVSLIVETAGARSYLRQLPGETIFLFVTVSDLKVLAQRLRKRGDQAAEIKKRLMSPEFKRDLVLSPGLAKQAITIVNDDWGQTKYQLDALMKRLKQKL